MNISRFFVYLFVSTSWLYGGNVLAQKSGVEPGVLVLPSGPGSLGGIGENVQANLNMGLMSYQIKIKVPQGRGATTPNPSVTYSSSAGSGIVGIGWNFSAGSSIERSTVRGLPTYTNEDLFYAGGELVKTPGGPFYRARYEGSFMRYRWVQKDANDQRGYWIAEAPDGTKMYYGANAKGESNLDAQIYGLKGTFRWELVTTVDRNGNRIEYSYFKEGAQTYPDQIAWVFDANNKPLYHLKFGYEDRPDFVSDGKPGFDLQTTKRLKEVQITSNGTRFRSYHFDFEDSTGLSRLIKVTRYGSDPKIAHPVQFSMKYSDAVFSPENSRMVTMPTALGVDFRTNNIDFIDINGDGLPDVVDTSKAKHLFFMNQLTLTADLKQDKHDFPSSQMRQNPTETSAPLSNPSVQMLDYNGDGFTDLVDAVNKKIYINKGNSQWENSSASLQNFPVTGTDPNMRFFDYNGDKAIDVISSDGSNTTYWVSDGKGNWKVTPGQTNIGLGFANDKLKLIDINGDGLQDIVHITKNSMRYRKYLGYGNWTDWIDVKVPGIDQYELSTQAQFNDINGDGMADMVAFLGNSIVYFVNKNGTEFTAGQKLQTFKGVDLPDSTKTTVRIVDINGNGSRDIVYIDSSGKVVYVELFGKRPNLMTEISNGIGQRINVEYGSSVYFYLRDGVCDKTKDKACNGPWQNKMPMPFNVVTKITTWASRSNKPVDQATPTDVERPQIQSLYYHNGFYDGVEKKFRGFRHVETLYDGDPSMGPRKDEIKYDVGDTDAYRHGKQLESLTSDGADKIYRKTMMEWGDCPVDVGSGTDPKTLTPPIRYVCLLSQEQQIIEGMPNEARTLRQEFTYDGFGNQILNVNLGDKDKAGDEQVTKSTYITPKNASDENAVWLLRFPEKMEYCDSKEATTCAEVRNYYDGEAYKGLDAGQIRKGNLSRTQVRTTLGKDDFVDTRLRKYNAQGKVVGSKDAKGNLRTYEWDSVYNQFPTTETIHLDGYTLTMKTEWDYALSQVKQSTDVNGQITRYTYDVFGRLLETYLPGDEDGKPSVSHSYELQAPLSKIITQTRSVKGKEFDQKTIQCFDGLGRKLSSLMQIDADKYTVYNHQEYTREGQKAQEWEDYQQSGDACLFVAPQPALATNYFYDGLRRPTKIVYADGGEVRRVYSPLKIAIYDPEDNKKDSPHFDTPTLRFFDGLNRMLEEHRSPSKGKAIVTKYTYSNVFVGGGSKIAKVTFADGSQKQQEYDLRGNTLKVIDPDRSEMTYTYTDTDQTASSTDARGIKLLYTYDALDRLVSRQQEGKPETLVTYAYDNVTKEFSEAKLVKGQLASITYPSGQYLYSYNERGLRELIRHRLLGVDFDIKSTYNNTNTMLRTEYPSGQSLEYQYDKAGRLLSIPGKIEALAYDELSRISSVKAANGIETKYAYDKRNRTIKIDVGSGKAFTMEYTRDLNGNFLTWKQAHGEDSFTHQYTYDSLYRLVKADLLGGKETLNYQQDDLHNVTSKTSSLADKSVAHIGDYSYDKAKIHAATGAGKHKMSYDKAGYMSTHNAMAFTWDELGRQVEAKEGDKTLQRTWYDHSSARIIKAEDGLHTFYIDAQFELREGTFVTYAKLGSDRLVGSWSIKGVDKFFDDVADGKADGQITAADAWVYHGTKQKLADLKATLKTRPINIDLTRDMLNSSAMRMLLQDKEETHYYHVDHLGSVRAVTNSKGDVLLRKHYYPYGAIRTQSGATQLFAHGYQNTELDKASGTNAFLLRSLDTAIGRWFSPDPAFNAIGSANDEFNSFGMVLNNPIRLRDFKGNDSSDSDDSALRYGLVAGGLGLGAMVAAGLKLQSMYFKRQLQNIQAGYALGEAFKGVGARHDARQEAFVKSQSDQDFDSSSIDKVVGKADSEASSMLTESKSARKGEAKADAKYAARAAARDAAGEGIKFAKSRQERGRFVGASPFAEGVDTKKVLTYQQVTGSGETEGRKRSRTRSGGKKSKRAKARPRSKSR